MGGLCGFSPILPVNNSNTNLFYTMGLAERRALKDFQDNHLATLQAQLNAAAGFDVPLEVDWDSMLEDDRGHLLTDGLTKIFFQSTIDAFASITRDDMGKEALKAGLEKIVMKNMSGAFSGSSAYDFADKVLTIDHDPYSNHDDIKARTEYLIKLLEKGL